MARLSVFAGGFSLEAAEALGSGEDIGEGEVLDPLSRLVDKSLVAVEEGEHDGAVRYSMLEPVRQYARERLRESGEDRRCPGAPRWVLPRPGGRGRARDVGAGSGGVAEEARKGARQSASRPLLGAGSGEVGEPREHRTELGLRLAGALGRFWGVLRPGRRARVVGKGPRKGWGGAQTRSGKGALRSRLDRALSGRLRQSDRPARGRPRAL